MKRKFLALLVIVYCICFILGKKMFAIDVTESVIRNSIDDVFIPGQSDKSGFKGYIGMRMQVNMEERLLKLNLEDILEPYVKRPGAQSWAGEHVGKWLHAACYVWKYTGDERLKVKMDVTVQKLIATQLPDGYLGTYLDEKRWTGWDIWSHKYNLIGLLTYYQMTGYQPALEASRKIGDLLYQTFGFENEKLDIVHKKHSTHVGMAATSVLEPMVLLYRYTGEKRYLDFCKHILKAWEQPHGPKILSSLLEHGNVYKTANKKAYEMLSCLVGLLELYRVTGENDYLKACTNAWTDIMTKRHYIIGTTSHTEHFRDDYDLRPDGEYHGTKYCGPGEGCVTVTWLQMNWHLLRLTGDPKYADELERITYNALLGAQSPRTGQICYFSPLIGRKRYGEVDHGITPDICCCSSSLPRGIALIPEFLAGTIDGNPAIILYNPGNYDLQVRTGKQVIPVKIKVESEYPQNGKLKIILQSRQIAKFKLLLFVPKWCAEFIVTAGRSRYRGEAGQFLAIERKWGEENIIDVNMDMTFHVIPGGKSYPEKAMLQRGPQVLAIDFSLVKSKKLPKWGWCGNQIYYIVAIKLAFRTFKIKGDIFLASARAAPSNAIDFEKVGLQKRVLNYYSYSNELFLKN